MLQFKALGVPAPEREYRFAAMQTGGTGRGVRKRLQEARLKDWRFDFAWPDKMLAVEVEGGGWINGRHNRGAGFEEDMKKYHHAMRLGWTLYRCGSNLIMSWEAAPLIRDMLSIKSKQEGIG